MKLSPPSLLLRFFRWFCHPELHSFIEGDLLELYEERVNDLGRREANLRFVVDVILLFRPSIIRPFQQPHPLNYTAMFKNYLTVAFRQIGKYPYPNALNLFSLVLGISCSMIILLFVRHELSYDQFHQHADRTWRITSQFESGGQEVKWAITNGYLASLLPEQVPEVEKATKAQVVQAGLALQADSTYFTVPENSGFFVDPNFLDVLDFEIVAGNAATMLSDPNSIVLTESLAMKYFGTTDVVGKTIVWASFNEQPLAVTGVLKDLPQNSHMQFDYLLPGSILPYWPRFIDPKKGGFPVYVYFVTWPEISEQNLRSNIAEATAQGYPHLKNFQFPIQKLTDIYFNADNLFEHTKKGNRNFISILTLVGFFILIIAGINYVIARTATSVRRADEMGVRKTLGSSRKSLIVQLLSESLLLSLIAGALSVMVTELLFRYALTSWFGIALSLLDQPTWIPLLLILSLALGLLAGLFPAWKISSFPTSKILRRELTLTRDKVFSIRSTLILLQFVFTIILIAGSIVVLKQLHFLRNKDVGYDKEAVINIAGASGIESARWNYFKEAIRQESGITSVGATLYKFFSDYNGASIKVVNQTTTDTLSVRVQFNVVDYDFIPTMNMQMVEGRNFSRDYATDTAAIIINEAAKKYLGLKNAVGQEVLNPTPTGGPSEKIIGVVNDFHFQNFNQEIIPIVLRLGPETNNNLLVRVNAQNWQQTLAQLERRWQESDIVVPFEYSFLDDWFEKMIEKETQQSRLVTMFTVLAIIIATLGLLGLISYTTQQKKREIGIRKVHGATVNHILALINQRFLILYVVALVVAVPISVWGIQQWLQSFAYRVQISVVDYLLTATLMLIIVIATISFQSIKAALANPVDSLHNE
ncbi:MAG: ABC transporter permease [Bacteroidota bacterium]